MRYNQSCVCGRSSSGRARPCQGRGSEFEPRRPLHKKQDHPMGGLVFCGANGIRWLETNSGFRTPQRGVETGSNSPVDCCVSENRASPKAGPRWDGFWIPVARFGARVRVAALSAASEPSQEAETGANKGPKENCCGRLGCALSLSLFMQKAPHRSGRERT